MIKHNTLVDVIRQHAADRPEQAMLTFLSDSGNEHIELTYRQLDQMARQIAHALQQLGATKQRVLLIYPPGLEFITAFVGCLYAGAIAVPAYPPRLNRPMHQLQGIVQNATPAVGLTTARIHRSMTRRTAKIPALAAVKWIVTGHVGVELNEDATEEISQAATNTPLDQNSSALNLATISAEEWQPVALHAETLAFLQYTSGSTASPKGVMVAHGNLLANLELIRQQTQMAADSRGVFWLPLYHDMGLIGGALNTILLGAHSTVISPQAFLQRPLTWLETISRTHATVSGGPNFGYALCVERISAVERDTLDLRSWEIAFSGAEPVRAKTIAAFSAMFAPSGFRRSAFYPCYGLAEATLMVSGGRVEQPPVLCTVEAAALAQNQVILAEGEERAIRQLVSSGQTLPGQAVRIVDAETSTPCDPDQVGEIWVAGPSVAQGYWNLPDATSATFGAVLQAETERGIPYLRTGDLGFLHEGELFVTGRLKDLIIIRGRNHYPQDIELTVAQSTAGLQPEGGAAFSLDVAGEERLVIVQEVTRQNRQPDVDAVAEAIRRAVAEAHDLQIHEVVLIKPQTLPKTSSGKVQRGACCRQYQADELAIVGRSLQRGLTAADANAAATSDAASQAATPNTQPTPSALLGQLLQLDAPLRQEKLASMLQVQIAQALMLEPAAIPTDHPLSMLGMDSLMLFELKGKIERTVGVTLPAYQFQEQASVRWIAQQILAQFAKRATAQPAPAPASVDADDGLLATIPLTPVQHALFSSEPLPVEPEYWNGLALLAINRPLKADLLRRAFQHLLGHHDALRLRFRRTDAGWQQFYGPIPELSSTSPVGATPESATATVPFLHVDLATQTQSMQEQAITEWIDKTHRTMDLAAGPLLQILLFDCGTVQANRLLFVANHMVFDGLSVLVLIQDLQTLYQQLEEGRPLHLPTKTATYGTWAQRLQQHVASGALRHELAHWRMTPPSHAVTLPRDDENGENVESSAQLHTILLDPAQTGAFRQSLQGRTPLEAEALILTALSQVCTQWMNSSSLWIEVERHGREPLFADVDLTRTVGFFNTRFPVLIDLHQTGDATPWQRVTKQLEQIPSRGIGYGMLRYLDTSEEGAAAHMLHTLPIPEIKLLYIGQLMNQIVMNLYSHLGDQGLNLLDVGMKIGPNNPRNYLIEVSLYFVGPQLRIDWKYSRNVHREATITQLAERFVATIHTLTT